MLYLQNNQRYRKIKGLKLTSVKWLIKIKGCQKSAGIKKRWLKMTVLSKPISFSHRN